MADICSYIPGHLDFVTNNPIINKDLHANLCMEIYNLIGSQTLQDNQFRLTCRFFQVTNEQLEQISEHYGQVFSKNPHSLWLLLNWTASPPAVLTRDDRAIITAQFTNQELNNRLKVWYQQRLTQNMQPGAPQPGEQGLFDSFLGFVNKMISLTKFLIIKAMRARDVYRTTIAWSKQINSLGAIISSMLLGSETRRNAYTKANELVDYRNNSIQAFQTYLEYSSPDLNRSLTIFTGLNYNQQLHFVWREFENTIANRNIWLEHHFVHGNQLQNILNDPIISPLSVKLDQFIDRIHNFSADSTEESLFKAQKLKGRIQNFLRDFEIFRDQNTQDDAKAGLLLSTCKFLIEQGESLSLLGVEFDTDSLGAPRTRLEETQIYLQKLITKTKADRDKKQTENKAAQQELSKGLIVASLPPLSTSCQWLHWLQCYKKLKTHFISDLSRLSLIRASLVKKFERTRVESMETSEEAISFLLSRYGESNLLIPQMMRKLINLPKATNELQLMKNFDDFDHVLKLLEKNELLLKLDYYMINQIIDKVLMYEAKRDYFKECFLKENQWKQTAGLPTEIDFDSDQLLIQTNAKMEELRRNHFIQFVRMNHETVRRMMSNNHFQTSEMQGRNRSRTNVYSTYVNQSQDKSNFICPLKCNTQHSHNVSKCPEFANITPFERVQKLRNLNICKRCLTIVKDWSQHKIVDNRCPFQKFPCSKCNLYSHSSHLHIESRNQNNQFNRKSNNFNMRNNNSQNTSKAGSMGYRTNNGQNAYRNNNYQNGNRNGMSTSIRQNNNRGGFQQKAQRGGQFKRPLRSARISQATKVSLMTPLDDCENEMQNISVNMLSFKTLPMFADKENKRIKRHFLTNVGQIRIPSGMNYIESNCLFDPASCFNFIATSLVKKLGVQPISSWTGIVKSLCSETPVTLPLYIIKILDNNNQEVKIPAFGYDQISTRNKLNDDIFDIMVNETGLQPNKFINIEGEVQLMIGLRNQQNQPIPIQMNETFTKKFPNIWVQKSNLCKKFFFSGSLVTLDSAVSEQTQNFMANFNPQSIIPSVNDNCSNINHNSVVMATTEIVYQTDHDASLSTPCNFFEQHKIMHIINSYQHFFIKKIILSAVKNMLKGAIENHKGGIVQTRTIKMWAQYMLINLQFLLHNFMEVKSLHFLCQSIKECKTRDDFFQLIIYYSLICISRTSNYLHYFASDQFINSDCWIELYKLLNCCKLHSPNRASIQVHFLTFIPYQQFFCYKSLINQKCGFTDNSKPTNKMQQIYSNLIYFKSLNIYPDLFVFFTDSTTQKYILQSYTRESIDYLRLQCKNCEKRSRECKFCLSINHSLSLEEMNQSQAMMKKIQIMDHPNPTENTKKTIVADFIFLKDPKILYPKSNTNFSMAKASANKFRLRLEKLNLLQEFDKKIRDEISMGYVEMVSWEEYERIQTEFFHTINFTMKLESTTKIRIVHNFSCFHPSKISLNANSVTGPNLLANPSTILHILRLHKYCVISDLKTAFQRIAISKNCQNLFLYLWFRNVNDKNSLVVMRVTKMPFGLSSSTTTLSLVIKNIISENCKTEQGRLSLASRTFVDDILTIASTEQQLREAVSDIEKTLNYFDFLIKEFQYLNFNPSTSIFDKDDAIKFLSLRICKKSDLMLPRFKITIGKKFRGLRKGPSLSIEVINELIITKKNLSSILGQLFCLQTLFIEPLVSILKVFFSDACKLVNSWDTDIAKVNKEFANNCKTFLLEMIDLEQKILPIPRRLIQDGETIIHLICNSDASDKICAGIIFMILSDENKTKRSRIIDARSKISFHNLPRNELIGTKVVLNLVQTYLQSVQLNLCHRIRLSITTDAKSTSFFYSPDKVLTDILLKNVTNHIFRTIDAILLEFQFISEVTLSYTASHQCPADVCTKRQKTDIISVLNSNYYRHGIEAYVSDDFPSNENIFLAKTRNEEFQFFPLYQTKDLKKIKMFYNFLSYPHVNFFSQKILPIFKSTISDRKIFDFANQDIKQNEQRKKQIIQCWKSGNYDQFDFEGTPFTAEVFSTNLGHPVDDDLFILEEDLYFHILNRSKRLLLLINILARTKKLLSNFKVNKKFSSQITTQDQQVVFRSLVLSHQHLFGVPKIKWVEVNNDDRLKTVNLRLPFKEISGNSMTKIPIINPSDKKLLFILIFYGHTKYVEAVSSRVHVTHMLAKTTLQQGPFPIFCPNLGKYLRSYIGQCSVCNRVKKRPFQASTSAFRFSDFIKQPRPLVMKFIAIDTIPNVCLRLSTIDKLNRPFTIYVVEDLVTSYVAFYLAESSTLRSTQIVINNVSNQFRTQIEMVLADRGSENFSLSPNDIIFNQQKNVKILILDSKQQLLSKAESSIAVFKRFLKTIFFTENKTIPKMTVCQLSSLLILLQNLINSRPCLKFDVNNNDRYFYYSPNDIFLGFQSVNEEIRFEQYSEIINSFQTFHDIIQCNKQAKNHILENLYNSLSLTSQAYSRKYKGTKDLIPKIGDIALMKADNRHKICKIVGINKSMNFAKIQIVKRNKMDFQNSHVSNLRLLYRHHPDKI